MRIYFNEKRQSLIRKKLTDLFCLLIPAIIYGIPFLTCVLLIKYSHNYLQAVVLTSLPFIYAYGFAFIAGIISIPFQQGIKPGRFPRHTGDLTYSRRKIYGTSWTTVYYCKPVYFLVLSSPPVRNCIFRLFGYKGNLNFTIYPDCWIRDLGVLDFGNKVYLSNRATIGSNICHRDNTISVDKISIGENSIIGHLAMIAHGVHIGSDSEIGVGCGVGINAHIGNHASIGPMSMINHYAQIGNHVRIGAKSYIGAGAKIADHLKIPAGSLIPDKANITGENDLDRYLRSTSAPEHVQEDLLLLA